MLKRILIGLMIMAAVNPLAAREWHPFVGVMGKFDIIMEGIHVYPSSWRLDRMDKATQFDAGVRTGKHELYLAFSFADSPEEDYYWSVTELRDSLMWQGATGWGSYWNSSNRVLAGYRFWPVIGDHPIVPTLGAAVEYVRETGHNSSYYRRERDVFGVNGSRTILAESSYGPDQLTDTHWDGLIETGVAIRIYNGVDLLALSQLHAHFALSWDPTLSGGLQLRYTFERR